LTTVHKENLARSLFGKLFFLSRNRGTYEAIELVIVAQGQVNVARSNDARGSAAATSRLDVG
jgi:hypothetical protein